MQLMIFLHGDLAAGSDPVAPIHAYFAGQPGLKIHTHEEFATDEVATVASERKQPGRVERTGSTMRALWVVDAASREAATEIVTGAPGTDGVLEIREAFMPEDFGEPAGTEPPVPNVARKPGTHRYLVLVRANKLGEAGAVPAGRSLERMGAVCEKWIAAGAMIGGGGLKASKRGTRVRRSAAQRHVLDGPFAESKELVGGYTMFQAANIEEVIERTYEWLAVHIETLDDDYSAFEIRRIVERRAG